MAFMITHNCNLIKVGIYASRQLFEGDIENRIWALWRVVGSSVYGVQSKIRFMACRSELQVVSCLNTGIEIAHYNFFVNDTIVKIVICVQVFVCSCFCFETSDFSF